MSNVRRVIAIIFHKNTRLLRFIEVQSMETFTSYFLASDWQYNFWHTITHHLANTLCTLIWLHETANTKRSGPHLSTRFLAHVRTRKQASPEHAFLVSRAHAQEFLGWGGAGLGNNVHLRLQTHALSWGRALVGWDGVRWGNNVHLRLQTHALSWGRALVGWDGVGWGNNVHLRLQTHALRWGRALVGWGGVG